MSSARDLVSSESAAALAGRVATCRISQRRSGSPWSAEFLAFDDFRREIDAAEDVVELELQGCGEPLLHPRFFDLVEYATRAGMRVSTCSNGSALPRANAERCVTSGLDTLRLVLGAVTAPGSTVRGRQRREWLLRTLDPLVAAREQLGSRHPHLHVAVVLMRRNVDELATLVERAARHGVEVVLAEPLGPPLGDSWFPRSCLPTRDCVARESLLRENPERVARAFDVASAAAARLGVELRLPWLQSHRMLWTRAAPGRSTLS